MCVCVCVCVCVYVCACMCMCGNFLSLSQMAVCTLQRPTCQPLLHHPLPPPPSPWNPLLPSPPPPSQWHPFPPPSLWHPPPPSLWHPPPPSLWHPSLSSLWQWLHSYCCYPPYITIHFIERIFSTCIYYERLRVAFGSISNVTKYNYYIILSMNMYFVTITLFNYCTILVRSKLLFYISQLKNTFTFQSQST